MPKFLFFLLLCLFACEPAIQKDYVELQIPPELAGNAEAVSYLEKDAKQLNRFFNSLDELATEFELIAEFVYSVDTTNQAAVEAAMPEAKERSEKLARSLARVNVNLMWYLGKDLLSGEAKRAGILEEIPSEEGKRAFRKSMEHIGLKKELLKERGEAFMARLTEIQQLHQGAEVRD